MSRFKTNVEIRFPDSASMRLVTKAGGVSKLKPEDAAKLKWIKVKAGSVSEVIPEKSVKWLLKQGLIESADEVSTKRKRRVVKGAKK